MKKNTAGEGFHSGKAAGGDNKLHKECMQVCSEIHLPCTTYRQVMPLSVQQSADVPLPDTTGSASPNPAHQTLLTLLL